VHISFDALEATLDLVGIVVFALSGALLAVRKRLDIVGLMVLALITATGGGVIRDLLIGDVPPAALRNLAYLVLPLVAALAAFVAHPLLHRLRTPVLVFDAAGLALYCVAGTAKAQAFGVSPLPAAFLGVTTAIGGGILRDVLAGEIPAVLRRDSELHAIPACIGAAVAATAGALHVYGPLVAAVAVLLTFTLRILALWRNWLAPHPDQLRRGR
jgi:uncharacterized membrane protein YeiH